MHFLIYCIFITILVIYVKAETNETSNILSSLSDIKERSLNNKNNVIKIKRKTKKCHCECKKPRNPLTAKNPKFDSDEEAETVETYVTSDENDTQKLPNKKKNKKPKVIKVKVTHSTSNENDFDNDQSQDESMENSKNKGTKHASRKGHKKFRCGKFYGWREFNETCYWLNKKSMTWEQAKQDCEAKNAQLISIHSDAENNFVAKMAKYAIKKKTKIWLGLKTIDNTPKWVDNSALTYGNTKYTKANSSYLHPWDETGDQGFKNNYCTTMNVRKLKRNYGKWIEMECDSRGNGAICKKLKNPDARAGAVQANKVETNQPAATGVKSPASVGTNQPASTGTNGGFDSTGWTTYNGYWYRYFPQEVKFGSAQQECARYGAHLVSIHSAAENDFVFRLQKNYNVLRYGSWIGLHRKPTIAYNYGLLRSNRLPYRLWWDDGTPFDYGYATRTNYGPDPWYSGHPRAFNVLKNGRDISETEFAIMLYATPKWWSSHCYANDNYFTTFICKKKI